MRKCAARDRGWQQAMIILCSVWLQLSIFPSTLHVLGVQKAVLLYQVKGIITRAACKNKDIHSGSALNRAVWPGICEICLCVLAAAFRYLV
jgi:hypothetical protein